MHKSFYRKYRPINFSEVYGQDPIIKTIENEIKFKKLSHAYLFAGSRGTGKTSVAKIFAKVLNCENVDEKNLIPCDRCVSCTQINNKSTNDLIEIDAASNNGIDEIRELKSKINLVPSSSKYKVYIIDEVHMMTIQAFNALLKTLEEPPSHVIFILATTDPEKIPLTILSRCQRFDFKRISIDKIVENLREICKKEKIEADEEALIEIAQISEGGMRDAISLLDQVSSFTSKKIELDDIHYINGTLTKKEVQSFILNLCENNLEKVLIQSKSFIGSGKNLVKITEELIYNIRDILFYLKIPSMFEGKEEEKKAYEKIIKITNEKTLIKIIDILINNLYELKRTNDQLLVFELMILKAQNEIDSNKRLHLNLPEKKEKKLEETENIKDQKEVLTNENKGKTDIKNEDDLYDIKKIKSLRINNALANLDKKEMKKYISILGNIRTKKLNQKYNYVISLLVDGKVKAYGNSTIVMVFDNKVSSQELNDSFFLVDEIFKETFNEDIKFISVDLKEWEKIKDEFNKKKKKYEYIEERIDIQRFALKHKKDDTEIDVVFGDIVEIK